MIIIRVTSEKYLIIPYCISDTYTGYLKSQGNKVYLLANKYQIKNKNWRESSKYNIFVKPCNLIEVQMR